MESQRIQVTKLTMSFDEKLAKAEASKRIDELQRKTGRGVGGSGSD